MKNVGLTKQITLLISRHESLQNKKKFPILLKSLYINIILNLLDLNDYIKASLRHSVRLLEKPKNQNRE